MKPGNLIICGSISFGVQLLFFVHEAHTALSENALRLVDTET